MQVSVKKFLARNAYLVVRFLVNQHVKSLLFGIYTLHVQVDSVVYLIVGYTTFYYVIQCMVLKPPACNNVINPVAVILFKDMGCKAFQVLVKMINVENGRIIEFYEFRNIGLCNILRLKRSGEDEDERTRCLSQDERIGDYQQLHNPML